MGAYSGALSNSAHFAFRPPVPGIDPRHEHPAPEPDPFDPQPDVVEGQTGDVWQPADDPAYSEMRADRISHTTQLQQAVPSNVYSDQRDIAAQMRMIANHVIELFRPDTYPPYRHADQGLHIQYVQGREPVNAGSTVPDDMAYLVAGRNSYDQTNGISEVYAAEEGGGGRYRLGTGIEEWGLYEFWLKQGQDGELRAYEGLRPQFPVDKPPVEDPAPYTPPSSGTTNWMGSVFRTPMSFALPSESVMTDYMIASDSDETEQASDFEDGGRL